MPSLPRGPGPLIRSRRFSRAAVKVYLGRLGEALDATFAQARTAWNGDRVLVRRKTVGNEVGWRLQAAVTWEHVA